MNETEDWETARLNYLGCLVFQEIDSSVSFIFCIKESTIFWNNLYVNEESPSCG